MPENEVSITAKEAYDKYHNQGMTQAQIAEEAGVSQPYISRLISGYDKAKETGREEAIEDVKSNPSEYDITDTINDEEPDDTPFEATCPECNENIPKPNTAGTHDCPECNSTLKWSESEI